MPVLTGGTQSAMRLLQPCSNPLDPLVLPPSWASLDSDMEVTALKKVCWGLPQPDVPHLAVSLALQRPSPGQGYSGDHNDQHPGAGPQPTHCFRQLFDANAAPWRRRWTQPLLACRHAGRPSRERLLWQMSERRDLDINETNV